MSNVAEREALFRLLSGNPTARKVAEKALAIEDEEEPKVRKIGDTIYPYSGWEWFTVQVATQTLNALVTEGMLVTGGARNTYRSNSSQTYKLSDPEMVRECLQAIEDSEQGSEEAEIPSDMFDYIIGHEKIKSLFNRALNSAVPEHILMVGPPACSKSMFLDELARLPYSRFTNGGGTSKAGLADYLLEFRPKYLIIDEIDKMDLKDASILLSLMQSGTVARLKKRMREIEVMKTWVFAAANRSDRIWPELKSRFFEVHLPEYSLGDFTNISESLLVNREKVEPGLARYIVTQIARQTRDVREAIHFAHLAKSRQDVDELIQIRWPDRRLV